MDGWVVKSDEQFLLWSLKSQRKLSPTLSPKGSIKFHSAQSSPSPGNMKFFPLSLDVTLQGLVTHTLIEKLMSLVHTHTHICTHTETQLTNTQYNGKRILSIKALFWPFRIG